MFRRYGFWLAKCVRQMARSIYDLQTLGTPRHRIIVAAHFFDRTQKWRVLPLSTNYSRSNKTSQRQKSLPASVSSDQAVRGGDGAILPPALPHRAQRPDLGALRHLGSARLPAI